MILKTYHLYEQATCVCVCECVFTMATTEERHCKPGKFNRRLNLKNLPNCLESLKFFVVNLLVHCIHCADQNPFR